MERVAGSWVEGRTGRGRATEFLEGGENGGDIGGGQVDEAERFPTGGAGGIVDGVAYREKEHVGTSMPGMADGWREDFRGERANLGGGRDGQDAAVGDEKAASTFGTA